MRTMNRIVSLVPSLTETLCHFGLEEQIVGCTSFCVEPKSLRGRVASVGGTKDASIEKIFALSPTHVILNTEENTAELIKTLNQAAAEKNYRVIETFLDQPEDNFELIRSFSEIFKFQEKAGLWCQENSARLQNLVRKCSEQPAFFFIYFIWMNPWMVAGDQTYISRCMEIIKGQNQIKTSNKPSERYPILDLQNIDKPLPQVCLFSSEPFPFRFRHIEKFEQEVQKKVHSTKVDGQALSWYGSRFEKTIKYLETLREKINQL